MPTVKCPYDWFCGKEFSLDAKQSAWLQDLSKKKGAIAVLPCPKCKSEVMINPRTLATEPMFENPHVKPAKKPKTSSRALLSKLKEAGITLPAMYREFVKNLPADCEVSIIRGDEPFTLYSLEELCEKVNISGKRTLTAQQLKTYAGFLKKIVEDHTTTIDEKGKPFTLKRLAAGLTIGYENERVLFIDPSDDNSLWIFHPDGGDVQRVRKTLETLTKKKI
jgi:hypothetical protein